MSKSLRAAARLGLPALLNAAFGYDDELRYWLHSVFVERLWVSQRPRPGHVHPADTWRDQLEETATTLTGQQAAWLAHRPAGWNEKQVYAVVRTLFDGKQKLLHPRHTFLLTNRTDLPLDEIVRRHRGKQGQENAQKGPLIDLDLQHPPCRR